MKKLLAVLACLCLLWTPALAEEMAQPEEEAVFRMPGPAVLDEETEARLREFDGIGKDVMLNTAFSILEEGQ